LAEDIPDKEELLNKKQTSGAKPSKRQKIGLMEAKALFSPPEQKKYPVKKISSRPSFSNEESKERVKIKIERLEKKIENESLSEKEEQEVMKEIARLEDQLQKMV